MSSTCPGEKRTGFEIIQPVALRLNFPQRTALYQNDMSKNSASSRVSWRSASSSGLEPVLILSNPLNRRSRCKNQHVLLRGPWYTHTDEVYRRAPSPSNKSQTAASRNTDPR